MSSSDGNPGIERLATARSRRAFLTMGAAAATGYGSWSWLRSRAQEDGVEWPLRRVLRGNERIAEKWFRDGHLSPTLAEPQVGAGTRRNGDVGITEDFDIARWTLKVQGPGNMVIGEITMAQIRELPRVEQITQLNCIEGWTAVAKWAGVRFADFTAKYAPQFRNARYVSMQTPDQAYFVGLDSASALHPQTLLCFEMNGVDLTSAHGAPLRLVIPVKYGVKNIKRIGKIAYTNERPEDYWANEGYDWYAGL